MESRSLALEGQADSAVMEDNNRPTSSNSSTSLRFFWDGGLLANTPLRQTALAHRQYWLRVRKIEDNIPRLRGDESTVRDEEFDDLTYEQLIQVTLKEFEEEEHAKKKRINILAKKLVDEGTPKNMISQKISRDLQGLVNPSYVRDCLGQAYKDRKQVREQTTSQARESTPADEAKKVLVKITNKGKQETSGELPTPKEQTTKEFNLHIPRNDVITIESLQDKVRIVEEQRDYFAKKLAEKSPEFPELYEEIEQLQEIESRRIKHHDFKSADSLGYNAGKSAPGTSCPPSHSQSFCNGYEYASGGSGRGYIQGVADPTHCDQPGFPACYDVGYHDGTQNPTRIATLQRCLLTKRIME